MEAENSRLKELLDKGMGNEEFVASTIEYWQASEVDKVSSVKATSERLLG